MQVLMKATISADFFKDYGSIDCYAPQSHWNGWGMPFFEKAQIGKLLDLLNHAAIKLDGDTIVVETGYDEDPFHLIPLETIEVDGKLIEGYNFIDLGWTFDYPTFAE